MAPEKSVSVERLLGPTEDMYWRFDSVSPLNFGSVVHLQGAVNVSELRGALVALQQRHPLLRVAIRADEKGAPWFREVDSSITLGLLTQAKGSEWALLEKELNTPFETDVGPLIRCILVQHDHNNASLISTYHHAVCDGRSAVFLLRDILTSLAQLKKGEPATLPTLAPVGYYGDRIPKMAQYADLDGLRTAWKTLQASVKFVGRAGLPKGIRNKSDLSLSAQELQVEPRVFDAALMQRIAHKAKQKGTSVQCVLNAALSLTVAQDSPASMFHATTSTQVLDIRARLIPPVGEDCGCFVSGSTSMHRISPDNDFWSLAREIHTCMLETMETPLPFFHSATHKSYALLGRSMGNGNMKRFSQMISKMHPEGLSVSNLGRVSIDVKDSPLQVTEFAFATNTNVLNYFNTSAATFNGKLTWSFSGSSMLGRDRIRNIADGAMANIMKALDQE
ncbi:hypothetical protein A9Q99_14650 [Gammaproteobacteria bacterium 45_16_T64]|nr:hypothetical protein A9Q99_14650 [Gammaproteobacteria bacterium 45_16_T64]